MKPDSRADPALDAFVASALSLMPKMLRGFMREERNALSRGRVTLPQFWMLQLLGERGTCRMHELSRELRISPSSATVLIDRLVELKLADRGPDADDRRAIRVWATAQGRAALTRVFEQKRRITRRLFTRIPVVDRNAYLRVLTHMVRETDLRPRGEES
jgi:DNA-binding MarR family transcriptional regulator